MRLKTSPYWFAGNAAYIYANPAEGIAIAAPFVTGLTAKPLNYPKPVAQLRRRGNQRRPAFCGPLVRQLQLHMEPAFRKLFRPGEFR
jgi:hypothetical protein